jgi:glycogen synthase
MRILFITAFYPPYVVGGWEQLVQDINIRLQVRGHETQVLTSTYGISAPSTYEPGVARLLRLEADLVNYRALDFFTRRRRDVRHNLETVRRQIETFRPDVVFIHVMWNLTRGIAWQAEQMLPGRVVYYVANNWPHAPNAHRAFWEDPARRPLQKVMKGLLAPLALRWTAEEEKSFPLRFERVLTVSQATKRDLAQNAGIPEAHMRVVYNGVELDQFRPRPDGHSRNGELALLYAGSLVTHKGVHTAVEALAHLKNQGRLDGICLTLVGSGHPDYEARLRRLVKDNQLEENVRFWGRVGREEMPALLQKFDVLIFPSLWDEPLARMMQEAMASGLVVVGTLTGGTPELLVDGETGLAFTPGSAPELAQRIEELRASPELRTRLAEQGRNIVLEKFDLQRMIDEIEENLSEAAGSYPKSHRLSSIPG